MYIHGFAVHHTGFAVFVLQGDPIGEKLEITFVRYHFSDKASAAFHQGIAVLGRKIFHVAAQFVGDHGGAQQAGIAEIDAVEKVFAEMHQLSDGVQVAVGLAENPPIPGFAPLF